MQAAILFGRKAPLLVSLYANSGVETRLAVYGFLANFGARRFPKGERKALWCARRRIPLAGGLTRRLRRGSGTCRPMGRSHFSFDGERKVCKRKPAARRLQRRPAPLCVAGFGLREPYGLSSTSVRCAHPPGKRLLLPILTAGLAMSRAMELGSFHQLLERARARLFPPSKWAGLFPSAAYRRSASPPLGWGQRSDSAGWEVSAGLGGSCGTNIQRGDLSIPSTYL